MLIRCTIKGCLQPTEAKLDKSTNEVICEECGGVVSGLTSFMKKSLESVGQVIKTSKKRPFQAYCTSCKKNESLTLKNKKAYCIECDSQVVVSDHFLNGLRTYLDGQDEEEVQEEKKAPKKRGRKKAK